MTAVPARIDTQDEELVGRTDLTVTSVVIALLVVQFVAMTALTIMSNAMPVIVAEIGGSPQQYTWVITAGMLANTVSVPIWGRLADLYSQKTLMLVSIGLFSLGSLLCGAATSAGWLIAFRVFQGMAMGGQIILSMTILANVVPPRQRGRYNGWMGAVSAAAALSGPLLGGLIVAVPWLGWRWTFWLPVPFMLIAGVLLGKMLNLPARDRGRASIDLIGAALLALFITGTMLWISMGGVQFERLSPISGAVLALVLASLVGLIIRSRRIADPIIPLDVLRLRNTVLACLASVGIGVAMMSPGVFLGMYFQLGRGFNPAVAGLLSLPITLGVSFAAIVAGNLVTRWGEWKPVVIAGALILLVGAFGMAALARHDTPLVLIGTLLLLLGVGVGAANQNLILAVQNSVSVDHVGSATSVVNLARTMGGAISVQVLGVIYVAGITARLRGTEAESVFAGGAGSANLDFARLPDGVEALVRMAYGDEVRWVFLAMGLISMITLVAAAAMRASSLRSTIDVAEIVAEVH